MNKNIIVPFLRLAPAVTALSLLGACGQKEESASAEEKLPLVKVQQVTSQTVPQIGTYTATVEPENINNISSSQPNRIKQILVDEGFRVSEGQTLVVLDDVNTTNYQLQTDNAKATLANAQLNYDRALELLKIGGGTQQNVDQMELQLTNARNSLANAERALRNAQENTVLVSPVSGVVTARNYDPGDMTGNLPILTVAQVEPVKIVINVSESEFSKVKKGMPAAVTFDTYEGEDFEGTVTMVAPTVQTDSRTFGVEITVRNPDSRILPGMFGRVTLNLGEAEHVVVPDLAVVKQPGSGNQYVYVYNPQNGTVSYNRVELGRRLGNAYELLSGVDSGSRVVVAGQTRLAHGEKVEIAPENDNNQ